MWWWWWEWSYRRRKILGFNHMKGSRTTKATSLFDHIKRILGRFYSSGLIFLWALSKQTRTREKARESEGGEDQNSACVSKFPALFFCQKIIITKMAPPPGPFSGISTLALVTPFPFSDLLSMPYSPYTV